MPKRIDKVARTIESLMAQTIKPDKIVLYLTDEEFPTRELPDSLREMQDSVFSIEFREYNLRPHNKYYYALQEFPDDIVITVDDDIVYPDDVISKLIQGHRNYPNSIVCLRAHTIGMYADGSYKSYFDWFSEKHIVQEETHSILATGVGGVLYPPQTMPKETFNREKIMPVVTHDDLWLKWMEAKYDVKIVLLQDDCDLEYVPDTQSVGLWETVNAFGGNDVMWDKLIKSEGEEAEVIRKRIYEDYYKHLPVWYEQAQNTIRESNARIDKLESDLRKARAKNKKIKNSTSYKIGRAVTFAPRKAKKLIGK